MRTPTRLMVALAAVAGSALYGVNTASAQSINLSGCSSLTVSGTTLTCVPASTGGGGAGGATVPSCVVNVSPPSGAAGTAVSVSASCSGSPTTYSWSGGFMQGVVVGSGSGNPSTSQTYTVVAGNSAGTSSASGTFTVQSSGGNTGGGNSGGGIGSCSGFNNTITVPVSNRVRAYSSTGGGFGNGTAMVVKFTTGANNGFGQIAAVEYNGQPTPRTSVLSANSCDFGPQQYAAAVQQGMSVTTVFSVGPNSWGYPALQPNTTYYFNIQNKVNGQDTCAAGDCPMSIDLVLP